MFCLTAKTALEELGQHAPEILEGVRATLASSQETSGAKRFQIELDADTFAAVPDVSFDYALMEKTHSAAVVPCSIGWSDVGSWNAIGELNAPDAEGNRVEGAAMLYNSKDCFIRSDDRLVAAVGVHDLVIVDTPDALLVADREHVQDVKRIVDRLRADDNDI